MMSSTVFFFGHSYLLCEITGFTVSQVVPSVGVETPVVLFDILAT